MRLVYVFNYTQREGYEFRAPTFVARVVCMIMKYKPWDYAPSPEGY